MEDLRLVKASQPAPEKALELANETIGGGGQAASTAVAVLQRIRDFSTNALQTLRESLSRSLGKTEAAHETRELAPQNALGRRIPDIERQVKAAAHIIDFAFYGTQLRGLMEMMPPRSLYGKASHASIKAFWEEALGSKVEDVAREYLASKPFPTEGDFRHLSNAFRQNTEIYLSVVAARDPAVIERAILLLPRYAQFCGATADPVERKGIDPAAEVEKLNHLFSASDIPEIGKLQVHLIDTRTYGTLEVSRFVDFEGSGEIHYSIGKDGVSYGISTKSGPSNLNGLFPDLAVADPRALRYPTYTELMGAIQNEGHNIRYDVMEKQASKLREYPPSGPLGFRYCSYEAQQSLEMDLPGKHEAKIEAINDSWNTQARLDVYIEAARSKDARIRARGTALVGCYPEGAPLLREALHDSSPLVVEAARSRLRG